MLDFLMVNDHYLPRLCFIPFDPFLKLLLLIHEYITCNPHVHVLNADDPDRSIFMLDSMQMLTKLRPFVRKFLKEASNMFEMYIYTMGDKDYAIEIAKLLDPTNVYFPSKVISNSDCTQRHQKGLDVILGAESVAVILDDTEYVSAIVKRLFSATICIFYTTGHPIWNKFNS